MLRLARSVADAVATVVVFVATSGARREEVVPETLRRVFPSRVVRLRRQARQVGVSFLDETASKCRIQVGPVQSRDQFRKMKGISGREESSSVSAEEDGALVGNLVDSARTLSPGRSSTRGGVRRLLHRI